MFGPAETFSGLKRDVKDPCPTWTDHPPICSTTPYTYPTLRRFLGLRCHSLLGSLFAYSIVEMTFIVHMIPRMLLREVPQTSSGRHSNTLPDLHSPTEARTRNTSATDRGSHNHPDRGETADTHYNDRRVPQAETGLRPLEGAFAHPAEPVAWALFDLLDR